jgi:hypothetical protein
MRSESTGQGALAAVNLNMRREHWIKRFEPTHAQREHLANCSGGWWLVAGSWRLAAGGWQLADGLAAAGRPAAGSWPAAGRQLAGSWPAGQRPAAGRQLAGSWPAAGQPASSWQLAGRRTHRGWWLMVGGWRLAAGYGARSFSLKIVFTQERSQHSSPNVVWHWLSQVVWFSKSAPCCLRVPPKP